MPATEKTKVLREKTVPVQLCLPQIPHGLQGKRLVITRAILWSQIKVTIWEYDHQWCIGKDLKGGGYRLFQGPTLEKKRTVSMRIITLAKI